ncbi:MAG: ATP-dependent ligase [Verrucomicrobiaceae bacterium]|nr:ATP-dependent ligase [Verrucomicrobiaceae bacterium]
MSVKTQLKVGSKNVEVSNLDKVLYPATGFTKGQMIDYYVNIAPVLLPHLKARPITLKRYPDGVDGMFFYEKQRPSHAPEWIETVDVGKSDGEIIHYCMINSLPALVWAANLANLEFHPFLHRATALLKPTSLVFDLDPGEGTDIIQCCEVALWIKSMFDALNLESFAKTSGSKGLQMVVPLNTATSYEKTKPFAHAVAQALEQRFPKAVVSKMQKELRKGRVLVDWSQNDDHKTTVGVYSLRAKQSPTVSTPVEWEEVEKAYKGKKAAALSFNFAAALKRVEKLGDLFAPVLKLRQKLPSISAVGGEE